METTFLAPGNVPAKLSKPVLSYQALLRSSGREPFPVLSGVSAHSAQARSPAAVPINNYRCYPGSSAVEHPAGDRVRSLVQEDPPSRAELRPGATAAELAPRAWESQPLEPSVLETALCEKPPTHSERPRSPHTETMPSRQQGLQGQKRVNV